MSFIENLLAEGLSFFFLCIVHTRDIPLLRTQLPVSSLSRQMTYVKSQRKIFLIECVSGTTVSEEVSPGGEGCSVRGEICSNHLPKSG